MPARINERKVEGNERTGLPKVGASDKNQGTSLCLYQCVYIYIYISLLVFFYCCVSCTAGNDGGNSHLSWLWRHSFFLAFHQDRTGLGVVVLVHPGMALVVLELPFGKVTGALKDFGFLSAVAAFAHFLSPGQQGKRPALLAVVGAT
jgi:hypothetical protein